LALVVVAFFGLWIYNLYNRDITNEAGLQRGLAQREYSKLRQPVQDHSAESAVREIWPLTTNLLTEPVAGNGVLHLFNYQALIIVWGVVTLFCWACMGFFVDTDFFRLGVRDPGETPRDNCIIVAWGWTTQDRLMYAKSMFVLFCYIGSFAACLWYAVFSLRRHQRLDASRVSHKDYCAICTGLPAISGTEKIEDELKKLFEDETGEEIIGVSICWDYGEKEDTLMKVIDNDLEERVNARWAEKRERAASKRAESLKTMTYWDYMFAKWENIILSPTTQKIVKKQHLSSSSQKNAIAQAHQQDKKAHDDPEEPEEIDVQQELEDLHTSDDAFIIFKTEAARDRAIEKLADGIMFRENRIQLKESPCEPQTVQWPKIAHRSWLDLTIRCVVAFLVIVLALAVWCFCFYLPYAQNVVRSDYAHGKDPDAMAKTMFGLIVVAGNGLMYVICAEVSDRVGFKTQASREVCYMLLYCFACVFNVVLDLVMAYKMAYKQMVGMGTKTHTGVPLSEVDTFAGRFESYAMQKSLGQILYEYSFPSTFLIPFLAEPVVTVLVPYVLMSLVVRTNAAICGTAAEAYLSSSPMDLSRYADVYLNLVLASLIFFFPGGYLLYLLGGLVVSHLVIYAYDHWRVLRSVQACDFATRDVDWSAQLLLSIPCGFLLSCAAFKANCHEDALHCWEDTQQVLWCVVLFVGHIAVHSMFFVYILPLFALKEEPSERAYRETAEELPCSWFASNPVHCLRSRYIYEHDPPCDYWVLGKDHLLRTNEKLNLYFHCATPRVDLLDAEKVQKEVSGKFSALRRSLTAGFAADPSQQEDSGPKKTGSK